jgi:aspartyl-tRNA(Asn)/glutamyl-tRNA(Gln) amidotransferase subunit B
MTHELLGQLAARDETFSDNPVSVAQLGELIDLVQDGKITGWFSHFVKLHTYNHHYQGLPGNRY